MSEQATADLHEAAWPHMVESLQEAYAELAEAQRRIEQHVLEADETRELFEQVIESMSEALLLVDRKGRLVTVNAAACDLLERDRDAMVGARLSEMWPGDDVPMTAWQLLERSPSGSLANLDVEVRPASGRLVVVQAACNVVRDKRRRIGGLLLVARDITDRQRQEQGQRLLADASALLASSLDCQAAVQRVAERMASGRVDWCAVYESTGDRLERIAAAGTGPALPGSVERDTSDGGHPVVRALARGRPAQRPAPARRPARRASDATSWLVAPLSDSGRSFGMLALGRRGAPALDAVDARFAGELARRTAQAIDRARLHAEVERARRDAEEAASVLQRVQQVSDVALAHLDLDRLLEELLERIMQLVEIEEAALFLPSDGEGRGLTLRAAPGLHPVRCDELASLVDRTATQLAKAQRSVTLPESVATSAPSGTPAAMLALPLRAGTRLAGVLLAGPRPFSASEVRLLELVADRAALAIDNARLYRQERDIAETLQRSLLPERLPRTPGIAVAARYFPGSEGTEVGGDWYDLVELPSGELAVTVGDVVGRGVRAAADMGQLRTSLRTYLYEGHGPREAIARLRAMSEALLGNVFATVLCLVLEPSSGRFRMTSAGHPPPLLRAPDGSADFVDGGQSIPLGVRVDVETHPEQLSVLERGSTLVMYTDGLVERRREVIDEGLARLRQAVSTGPELADSLVDHVTGEMFRPGDPREDDSALLALRRIPVEERLGLRLPSDTAVVRDLRAQLTAWLGERGVGGVELEDVVMACSEVCINAIEHPVAPRANAFEFELIASGASLEVTVSDTGSWRERAAGTRRGYGLQLARAVMEEVEVETGEEGTRVRMRRRLHTPADG